MNNFSYVHTIITDDDDTRVGRVFSCVYVFVCAFDCLSVCLFLYTISQQTTQLGSPLGVDMVHYEFWKSVYYGVKRSKAKVTRHKKTLPAWVMMLL